MGAFQDVLAEARDDPSVVREGRSERQQLEAEGILGSMGGLEPLGTEPSISDKAVDMIVVLEVSGKAAYERRYRHPVWPKGRSGITCGIGYDVGYVTRGALAADWGGYLAAEDIELLASACGVKGPAAQALLPRMSAIDIPFERAMAVFRNITLVQTATQTTHFLPNAVHLHQDSFGALVSLVYNRGASFGLQGDRYAEMRQIRQDIAASMFARVPQRIRNMKRLWQNDPDARGLVMRRELEAVLFEEGLAASS